MKFIQIANRLSHLSHYPFVKLLDHSQKIEQETDRKVLNLSIGNPDIPPSSDYLHKLTQFYTEPDAHLYPPFGPLPEFTEAIIAWYKKRFNVVLTDNEIYPLLGAKEGIAHLPLAILNQGDEILVPDPGYPAYSVPAKLTGAIPVPYELKESEEFKINIKELESKITSKTRAVWVNFPSNPTGQTASLSELEVLIQLAKKHQFLLLYDNAYSEITFEGFEAPSILEIPDAKDVAVEISSFSKTFSFAGFRMGWIVGNRQIIAALAKVKTHFDSGLSRPLQKFGAYALTHQDRKWHTDTLSMYEKRREKLLQFLTRLGLKCHRPSGALYIWAQIADNEQNSELFCKKLLEDKFILLTPGIVFGVSANRFVRTTFANDVSGLDSFL